MSAIHASAPGKLRLAGEYAVLEGAPALVLVDRRARVMLQSAEADYWIEAPQLGIALARGRLHRRNGEWQLRWLELDQRDAGAHVIESLAADGVPTPFRAHLDTRALFTDGTAPVKLGVGSSAALTVTLAASIRAHDGGLTLAVQNLVAMHTRLQDGRGSGLDIAASRNGGLILYRRADGQSEVHRAAWPEGLHARCVWSGKSASTGTLLRQLAQWRARSPQDYGRRMRVLGDCAHAVARAIGTGGAAASIAAVADFARALQQLDGSSGIDIVCSEHRRIGALAAECGVTYKSCGAGGGDVGIGLALEPECLQRFAARLPGAIPGAAVVPVFQTHSRGASPGLQLQSLH